MTLGSPRRAPSVDRARRINFRAAWARLIVAGLGLTVLPLSSPKITAWSWVLLVYLVAAAALQVAIYRQVGGKLRILVAGVVDMSMVAFFMHRIGSQSALLMSLLVMTVILYTVSSDRRTGQLLAMFASVEYVIISWLEGTGVLPYAPDAPPWASAHPHPNTFIVLAVGIPVILFWAASIVGRLLDEVAQRERELEVSSRSDSLTQIANRRHLLERMEVEIARVKRGHPLVAVMIDLDGFKAVNDTHGHVHGDEVLAEIAHSLEGATRDTDVVGRYGGDEFLVLLPDSSVDDAGLVVRRLLAAVRAVGERHGSGSALTASVGVAAAAADDDSISLMRRADRHAYEAKRAGGDRAVGMA